MTRIDDLEAFVAIVEEGGQTAAARHLRRSLQSISRSLAAVEQDIQVELIRRTTPLRTHRGRACILLSPETGADGTQ